MSTHVGTQKHDRSSPDTVRIPADLRAYLREQALKNTRSFSGEIVHRLEASRKADLQPLATAPNAQKGTP
ncbi:MULTISPECIES: Arc family DNA-binding protein [Comamonas]|uniref:Arc family DNA-binding protein n=1 Tax=Comamonas TaxID=283 RepID=UPI00391EFEB7